MKDVLWMVMVMFSSTTGEGSPNSKHHYYIERGAIIERVTGKQCRAMVDNTINISHKFAVMCISPEGKVYKNWVSINHKK